ncbi:MAG: isocitrate/isopropylmalate family dehydrogenase, partial [Chloroflexota bacterium]
NPIATVASAALMLRLSIGEAEAADALDTAVDRAIEDGPRTADLGGDAGTTAVADFLLTTLAAPVGASA